MRCSPLFPLLLIAANALAQAEVDKTSPENSAKESQTPVVTASAPTAGPKTLSSEQIKSLIHQAADKDIENDKKQRDYTYMERVEEHHLGGHGDVKSTEVRVYDVLEIYGEQMRKMISKNGKPLSGKDAAKEDERIQKVIDHRKNESDSERAKRLKQEEKSREEDRQFVKEVEDAYNFKFVGVESLQGRDAYVIDAEPRAGFAPRTKVGKVLPKFRFRLWLDRAEGQWVKLDANCIDTVSLGLFLARVHKGSRILIETTRVNDEVWLPQHIALHVDVRLALLKNFDMDQDLTYTDYKKFHTQSKIVGMEEIKEQH